jgi:DNA-binding transcriptional LysR family regulator
MDWAERIGRRVKLRDLHILLAVAQQGSMGRAATHLAVSQPVVSKAIADIEHVLGVRLLERSPLGVEPTRYGEALVKWGTVVFDDLRQSIKEVEYLADPTAGTLRIGTTEGMTGGFLFAIIDKQSRRFPRIRFEVTQTPAVATQYEALRNRQVDLILGRVPERRMEKDIASETLFSERLHIVAGPRSPWLRPRKVTLAEIIGEPWVLPPVETIQGSLLADAFRSEGLQLPESCVSTVSMQLYMSLLSTGRYLAALPSSLLRFGPKELPVRRVPIKLQQAPWPVAIATLKNRMMNPVAEHFIAEASAMSAPLRIDRK